MKKKKGQGKQKRKWKEKGRKRKGKGREKWKEDSLIYINLYSPKNSLVTTDRDRHRNIQNKEQRQTEQ